MHASIMATSNYVLRCRTKDGQLVIDSLNDENSVEELAAAVFSLTGIYPQRMKLLIGYPPKQLVSRLCATCKPLYEPPDARAMCQSK